MPESDVPPSASISSWRSAKHTQDAAAYAQRYLRGEWRTPIFRDMILEHMRTLPGDITGLDIGCGTGFDGEREMQAELASACRRLIGVEPDPDVDTADFFQRVDRCVLEDAPISPNSIDVAWAVMVMEHLENPQRFFQALHRVLKPGGVFFGFTVDSRHYFAKLSRLLSRLNASQVYLNFLHGWVGVEEFRHYPTRYRCNSPQDILAAAPDFRGAEFLSLIRPGQVAEYLPRPLRASFRAYDHRLIRHGQPGAILAVRLQK